ncbi:hypothetical protein JCM10207_003927 [Rhodosporidiobolus poonsookiae]
MASKDPHPCYVCGEPTTTRCPVCSKAGVSTYFDRKCQVLAWPAHSKTCSRQKPFAWPALDEKEFDHLQEIANEMDPMSGESIADAFGGLFPGVPVKRLLFELALQPSPLPPALFAPLLTAARSSELGHFEAKSAPPTDNCDSACDSSHSHPHPPADASSTPATTPSKPFLPLPLLRASNWAYGMYTFFTQRGKWSATPTSEPWWTPFHLKLVQLAIVHDVMCTAGEEDTELRDKAEKHFVKVENDLRDFLAGPELQLARKDIEELLGDLLQEPSN